MIPAGSKSPRAEPFCPSLGVAMKRALALLGMVLLLVACQQTLQADVTTFTTLSSNPQGKTFSVVPDKDQAGSLEFQHYTGLIANALQIQGFTLAPAGGPPPDLVVQFHYGYGGSQTQAWYEPGPPYAGWYGPSWWGWGGYNGGFVNTYTVFSHFLIVEIFDGAAWRRDERQMVFEGRALGQAEIRALNQVMPYLVQALFKNFPGMSGQTLKVSIPIEGS